MSDALDRLFEAECRAGWTPSAASLAGLMRERRAFGVTTPGARPQRPLWASTGVGPAYDNTRYVVKLVVPRVVNIMPKGTLDSVADPGALSEVSMRDTYAGHTRCWRILPP